MSTASTLKITATVNGHPMLASTVDGARIAGLLAKHATMDDWVVAKGASRDDILWSVKEALENQGISPASDVLSTLLWAACRGENGSEIEDAIRHGGVTLMCALKGDDSSGVSLLCIVSPDPTQH